MRRGAALLVAGTLALCCAGSAAAATPHRGDVIVGDSTRAKVYILDPGTGDKKVLSKDSRFVTPNDSAFSPNGKRLYVADYDAFNEEGGVFQINTKTGKTTVLAKKHGFEQPDGIAVGPDGTVFVTDLDATDDDGALFRINPKMGKLHLVSSGDGLMDALGVVVPPSGKPIVASSSPVITKVDPGSGDQTTIVDAGDGLTGVGGLARGSDGTLYIASDTTLESVDPQTGEVDTVAEDYDTNGYGLAIDGHDRVLGSADTEVIRAAPATGDVTTIGENFSFVEGLEVVLP
jgi:DNA-binding beta-propeller fold protein YncE